MPRYYFHCADGHREPDLEGTVLTNDEAAQHAAIAFAGEVLKGNPTELWQKGQWRVEVTDAQGVLLFTVITLAVDAPKPLKRQPTESAND